MHDRAICKCGETPSSFEWKLTRYEVGKRPMKVFSTSRENQRVCNDIVILYCPRDELCIMRPSTKGTFTFSILVPPQYS